MIVLPVTLENSLVRLEPLSMDHCDPLCEVAFDERLWNVGMNSITTREEMEQYIAAALKEQSSGTALPFATIFKKENKAIGSTRFGNIDRANRKAEIGWTWIGSRWQRTGVNTAAKFLMLQHAFEVWKCIRVEFKTDVLNTRSRAAIQRIGAKEEGILRNHAITSTGRIRNSVYYSIVGEEWEQVKQHFINDLLKP